MASVRPLVKMPRQRVNTVRYLSAIGISFALTFPAFTAEPQAHNHPAPVVLAPGYSHLEFIPPPAGSYQLPPLGHAANGRVLDANGKARELHELVGGKITVLSFIYTSCDDVNGCPLATYVLKGVQDKILEDPTLEPKVRLVSMSFDPARDTPKVLSEYSSFFKAKDFDWQFLTTTSTTELDPILSAYNQSVIRDYDEQGNFMGTLSHILRVVLIDEQRRIRNIYSTSFLHADTVANDIRTLLQNDES